MTVQMRIQQKDGFYRYSRSVWIKEAVGDEKLEGRGCLLKNSSRDFLSPASPPQIFLRPFSTRKFSPYFLTHIPHFHFRFYSNNQTLHLYVSFLLPRSSSNNFNECFNSSHWNNTGGLIKDLKKRCMFWNWKNEPNSDWTLIFFKYETNSKESIFPSQNITLRTTVNRTGEQKFSSKEFSTIPQFQS